VLKPANTSAVTDEEAAGIKAGATPAVAAVVVDENMGSFSKSNPVPPDVMEPRGCWLVAGLLVDVDARDAGVATVADAAGEAPAGKNST